MRSRAVRRERVSASVDATARDLGLKAGYREMVDSADAPLLVRDTGFD